MRRDASGRVSGTPTTITQSGATATMNCTLNDNFTITPTANLVLDASNLKVGKHVTLQVVTSGATSFNIMFTTVFKSKGVYRTKKSTAVTDLITFYSDGTNLIEMSGRNMAVWTPASMSECELMLEADSYSQSDNTNITTSWVDYSQLARNCTITGTPTFQTNELNGLSIIRIGASTGISINLPNLSSLTSGSMYLVVKLNNTTDNGGNLFGTSGNNSHYPFSDTNVYDDFGSTVRKNAGPSGITYTNWHLININSRPSYWQMIQNTTQLHSTVTNTVGFNTAPKLGQNGAGTSLQGDYYGLYLFNDQLDISDDKKVRDYIKFRTTV